MHIWRLFAVRTGFAASLRIGVGLCFIAAAPALATQEYILPTLFDVTGVAQDDRLNIRATPNASAEILGTLAPDARDIEVVGNDASGRWARVNTGEQSGWVAMRYLMYRVDVWQDDALPPTLRCFGNEPFWSLAPEGDTLVMQTPQTRTTLPLRSVVSTGIFRDPRRGIIAQDTQTRLGATVVPMACSDGMSDRAFGLDVTVMIEDADGTVMLTGCCSIAQ